MSAIVINPNLRTNWSDSYTPLKPVLHEIDAVVRYAAQAAEWVDITAETVIAAKILITSYYHELAKAGYLWIMPHVSSDAEGGITFEWWHNHFSLTLYVHPDRSSSYLLAWGLDIWSEMETGENPDQTQRLELWRRLHESE